MPHDGSAIDLLIVSAGVVLGGTGLTEIMLLVLIQTDLAAVYGNEIMGNVLRGDDCWGVQFLLSVPSPSLRLWLTIIGVIVVAAWAVQRLSQDSSARQTGLLLLAIRMKIRG